MICYDVIIIIIRKGPPPARSVASEIRGADAAARCCKWFGRRHPSRADLLPCSRTQSPENLHAIEEHEGTDRQNADASLNVKVKCQDRRTKNSFRAVKRQADSNKSVWSTAARRPSEDGARWHWRHWSRRDPLSRPSLIYVCTHVVYLIYIYIYIYVCARMRVLSSCSPGSVASRITERRGSSSIRCAAEV